MTAGNRSASKPVERERPIRFSAPMVKALLAGTKTQTRRVVKPQPEYRDIGVVFASWVFKGGLLYPNAGESVLRLCPYGVPGDRLWVRETWMVNLEADRLAKRQSAVRYRATDPAASEEDGMGWRPSIFMPRWASRIVLELTDVRVQHVAEISEEDAIAEGCEARQSGTWWQGYSDPGNGFDLIHTQHRGESPPDWMIEPKRMKPTPHLDHTARDAFRMLWEQINPGTWAPNPWVWALTFKRLS